MIIKRQNMSEKNWNHFKIVPKGHNHCQLSIVNCQFGEAVKFQFIETIERYRAAQGKNDHTYLSHDMALLPHLPSF